MENELLEDIPVSNELPDQSSWVNEDSGLVEIVEQFGADVRDGSGDDEDQQEEEFDRGSEVSL